MVRLSRVGLVGRRIAAVQEVGIVGVVKEDLFSDGPGTCRRDDRSGYR